MLCEFALGAYSNYNVTSNGQPRAVLINYESLPGIIPRVVLPFFGYDPTENQLSKMEDEAKHYSKSRNSAFRLFFGDSEDKDTRATQSIQKFAESILEPTYEKLNNLAVEAVVRLNIPERIEQSLRGSEVDWSVVKEIRGGSVLPDHYKGNKMNLSPFQAQHSSVLDPIEYVSWAPFANTHTSTPFERVPCPLVPAADYPKPYPIMDLLNNWNTDSTDIPPFHYDSLCHFDYRNETQRKQAYTYREKEVPFVMYNIPELDEVVKKWNDMDYLSKLLGNKNYRTEASESNHFMYWRGGGGLRGKKADWRPPTKITSMKFKDWLQLAASGQNQTLEERTHRYFRASSDTSGNEWLFDELPFFQPKKNLFLVNPREQHGIHCRFGMRSVIAEAHFDGSRNSVVEIGGLRRWILTHPDQCKNMHMLPPAHPSGRHSAVDWSKPDLEQFPNFSKVGGNEVILQPGDFLFVPTFWIHYIVSLNINFQCNTRSGVYQGYNKYIKECGF